MINYQTFKTYMDSVWPKIPNLSKFFNFISQLVKTYRIQFIILTIILLIILIHTIASLLSDKYMNLVAKIFNDKSEDKKTTRDNTLLATIIVGSLFFLLIIIYGIAYYPSNNMNGQYAATEMFV